MISRDKRVSDQEVERFKENFARFGNDTAVRCFSCGRTQYLNFADGLRNGWSKCCGGYTMTVVYMNTDIDKAVGSIEVNLRLTRLMRIRNIY